MEDKLSSVQSHDNSGIIELRASFSSKDLTPPESIFSRGEKPVGPEDLDIDIFFDVRTQVETPPAFAERLFRIIGPAGTTESQLADLEEMFNADVQSFGEKRARQRYMDRIGRCLVPLVWERLKNWGVIAILIDYGRKKFGL